MVPARTGTSVQFFSARDAAKVVRLRRNPEATLLVTNAVGEPEHWIAFDGKATVHEDDGFELAEKLAPRYWDMSDPVHKQTLATWREHASALCRVTLSPQRIRKGH
ncbi:MAG: pyridoxamine 5'-phosphate oxidase family protein [Gammaproteobacteria bacterium]|nr:pyridoxamine 5'-phosphate oxidase family protein [Gammaproteobacteria bacterium]